ncbi:MAG: hypothetical protein J3Q66DRAFT_367856 [Benniella sp.]|nr:MAG: hypothetical protein J3Q66DRAFT_367856 [Benniella sp.]
MGLQGVYQYLETHRVLGAPVDTTQVAHIHVDVLSIYFAYLVATMKSLLDRGLSLNNRLESHFHRTKATLHIDGTPTLEKTQAHTASYYERPQRSKPSSASASTSTCCTWACRYLHPLPANQPTIKRLLRVYRSAIRTWRTARTFEDSVKAALVQQQVILGWTVCPCTHEADVCIANRGGVTVASTDSDFLFHPVRVLLRPDPANKWNLYQYNQIQQLFGQTMAAVTTHKMYLDTRSGPTLSEAYTTSESTVQAEVAPSTAWSHSHGTPQRVAQSPPVARSRDKIYDDAFCDAFYQKTITRNAILRTGGVARTD